MSEARTPGPWIWKDEMDFENLGGIAGANGEKVCSFGDSTQYYPTEGTVPSDVDKALILAAPDLLEALNALVEPYDGDAFDGRLSRALRAINKAEGRLPAGSAEEGR